MKNLMPSMPTLTRLAAAAALAACAGGAGAAPAELSRIGALLPLAQFRSVDNAPLAVAERAGTLASLLAGSDVPAAAPDVTARALALSPSHAEFAVRSAPNGARALVDAPAREAHVQRVEQAGTDAEVAARARAAMAGADPADRIRVMLDLNQHETLALHGAVADDYQSEADVGAARARAAFDAALQRLQANSAFGADALALDGVKTARLMQAERAADGPVKTRVKAYLFEVPYALGGIPVFGAEAVVAVHRSGQLQSIRMTGPAVTAAPQRAAIRRAVSAEALEQRARADNPGATIVALGLQYPWQATANATLASRPREAFQVLPKGQADGAAINGRAHYVFYSVEDERAAPLVWPTPRPDAVGDSRP